MLREVMVSVIIPFYRNKIWLEEAIKSVLAQSLTDFEIIVINDGSEENINDLLSKYSGHVKFISTINKGAAIARNVGIKVAKGKFLAFLDSDDLWAPQKLEKQVSFMVENNYKWSHTDYYRFSNETNYKKYIRCDISGYIFPKALVWNPIATPCVMVDRQFVLSNNLGFEENKTVGEDNYFWGKIGKLQYLGYLNEALTCVRIHGSNIAFNAYLQLKGRGELIENLKANKHTFNRIIIYYYLLFTLCYCKYSVAFFSKVFRLFGNNYSKKFQTVFKTLYGIAYINFRIIRSLL